MTATLSRSMRTNPLLAAVGTFDLTLLVGAVLPLTVIILTYNLVAADREQGRWDLIRAHAASMPRLVTVRCLIRIAALGLVVILVTVCWTFLVPAGSRNGVAARNFALWSLWLCAHLAFWAAMTMLVNSLRLSSSGSGLLLLLGWCLLVLAIPSAVERGINSRFSMPSFSDLIAMELEVRKQIEQDANAVWADFLQRHAGIHLDEDNPQREFLLRDIAMSEVIRLRVHERTDEYFQQFLQREELLDRCQLLSPLLAWRTAADQCAGTSLRHFLALARQTETFHDHFLSHFETLSLAGRELTLADIREVPRFDVKDLQSSLDPAPLLLSATSLLLWTAVCGWLSWQMFQRSGRH